MIIYFSSTGNCEYIAKTIASQINDNAIDMRAINNKIVLKENESLGIITPTYYWRLPSYVEDWLENINIENADNTYIYYIATYGTTSGQTDYYVKKYLKKKSLNLNASYSIKTVDNWTVLFDVSNKEDIKQTLDSEKEQTLRIINQILNKENIYISKDKKSVFMCNQAKRYYDKARRTKHLHVTDDCINCGLCKNNCPVNAIEIINDKPIWVKDKCVMCFGCLHNCPKFAIHYDNKTQNHGQYRHPEFKDE